MLRSCVLTHRELGSEEATSMQNQIIDAVMARSIHTNAVRTHPLAAWVIVRDQIDYPRALVARR